MFTCFCRVTAQNTVNYHESSTKSPFSKDFSLVCKVGCVEGQTTLKIKGRGAVLYSCVKLEAFCIPDVGVLKAGSINLGMASLHL